MSIHEECGVFGVFAETPINVANICYYGLYALQHRGQERCGIVVNDDGLFVSHKDLGLVSEVFSRDTLSSLPAGTMAVAHNGNLCLAIVEGRAPFVAARWIAGFHDEFPLVHFSLWNGSSDEAIDRLFKGLADAAFIAAPYDMEHLEGLYICSEPWVAIIPKDHPLAKTEGPEIPLSALADEMLILPDRPSRIEAIQRWLGEIGKEPQRLCETASYLDAVALAEQSVGIAIFPQTTYTPNNLVETKVITDPIKKIDYYLVWPTGEKPSRLTQLFLDHVTDFIANDRIHSERFRVRGAEYELPEDAEITATLSSDEFKEKAPSCGTYPNRTEALPAGQARYRTLPVPPRFPEQPVTVIIRPL